MLIDGIAGLAGRKAPVVVIGSGPVGLALATELAAQGISVIVLESGGVRAEERVQALSDAEIVDPDFHDPMNISVARRLGGTSNLWGARCLPFDPIDFAARPFVDARWPVSYDDLKPYWARAVAATASGAADYAEGALAHALDLPEEADDAFCADRLERWANVQAAQDVHRDAIHASPLIEVRMHATAIDMEFAEDGRLEAIHVAHSLSGERARLAIDRLVIAAGGIETTRLLMAAQRAAPERFGGEDGPLGRYYMGHLMGEIADIVFEKPEQVRAFGFMVDRHGSYVRRRIVPSDSTQMQHGLLNSAFWPVVPPIADARHHNAALSLVYLAIAFPPLGRKLVAEAIRRRHIPAEKVPILPHIGNVVTSLPESARFGIDYLRKRRAKDTRLPGVFLENSANRYGLGFHSEQVPQTNSRVRMLRKSDRLGLPSLSVDLRFCEQDVASLVRTHDLLEKWLTNTRVARIEYRMAREERHEAVLSRISHGTHQIGLARMGETRRAAVVDRDLRCFDTPNLYLASCAVLPTSGQANPTLTAIALTVRLADHLRAEISFAKPVELARCLDDRVA